MCLLDYYHSSDLRHIIYQPKISSAKQISSTDAVVPRGSDSRKSKTHRYFVKPCGRNPAFFLSGVLTLHSDA